VDWAHVEQWESFSAKSLGEFFRILSAVKYVVNDEIVIVRFEIDGVGKAAQKDGSK
jgi:hypothetical protein